MKKDMSADRQGFTLVELLIVMAILGVLMMVTLANFRTSQAKSRDARRKSDLHQIANALEAYSADHGAYPLANPVAGGKIKSCGCGNGTLNCDWDVETGQREFCDANNTVYMVKIAGDPAGTVNYCYRTDSNNTKYQLYARLENTNDPDASLSVTCGGYTYNFGVSSGNTKPGDTI